MRFSIAKMQSIRCPMPGDNASYICKNCGHWFIARIPIWKFFGLEPKCPHCDSRQTRKNPWIQY